MANNRMVLVCKTCVPNPGEWVYHTPPVFVLAKYYPSTGYYTARENMTDDLNKFLDEHRHEYKLGYNDPINKQEATWGPDLLFRLEYECEFPTDGTSRKKEGKQ